MGLRTQNLKNCRFTGVLSGVQRASTSNGEIFSKSEWAELVDKLSLSPRQTEVIEQLLSSRSDKQIARELEMALPTVRTHLSRLFSKFDVQDRTELILYVFRRFREDCRTNGCPRL